MALERLPKRLRVEYELHEWRHASAVLLQDFSEELKDIVDVLDGFRLRKSRIVVPGGAKSLISGEIDGALAKRGWEERDFTTAIVVDEHRRDSPTHKVDCVKNGVGLEIEWNNKDPFFDRDLNNFRLLFDLRVISVGVIITRCDELQAIFTSLGKGKSYGNSTTHMSKLLPRLNGGSGGGCPILVFGISKKRYVDDVLDADVDRLVDEFKAAKKSKWTQFGPVLTKYIDPSLLQRKKKALEEEEE